MPTPTTARLLSARTASPDASARPLPACSGLPRLFQHPLLETPPRSGAPVRERRQHAALVAAANQVCRRYPLLADCLYSAVVEHDVTGYVAGTTARQRAEVRRRLDVVVAPEDFDTLAGVTGGNRQVDHEEVLRLRAAHPDESLEVLARRLGCSLSTVKRHLRRERRTPSAPRAGRPRSRLSQVLAVAVEVTAGTADHRAV